MRIEEHESSTVLSKHGFTAAVTNCYDVMNNLNTRPSGYHGARLEARCGGTAPARSMVASRDTPNINRD